MPRGVTFVVALPAVPFIFTRAYAAGTRPIPGTWIRISTVACDCEVTTGSLLRATRKYTFSDGTAPATSPSLHRHVAKSRSVRPIMPRSSVIWQRRRDGQWERAMHARRREFATGLPPTKDQREIWNLRRTYSVRYTLRWKYFVPFFDWSVCKILSSHWSTKYLQR